MMAARSAECDEIKEMLNDEIDRLQEVNKQLDYDNKKQRQLLEGNEQFIAQITEDDEALHDELSKYANEIAALRKQLMEHSSGNDDIEGKMISLLDELDSVTEQSTERGKQLLSLVKQEKEHSEREAELQRHLSTCQEQNKQLEEQVAKLEELMETSSMNARDDTVAGLKKKNNQLMVFLTGKDAEIKHVQIEYEDALEALHQAEMERALLKEQYDAMYKYVQKKVPDRVFYNDFQGVDFPAECEVAKTMFQEIANLCEFAYGLSSNRGNDSRGANRDKKEARSKYKAQVIMIADQMKHVEMVANSGERALNGISYLQATKDYLKSNNTLAEAVDWTSPHSDALRKKDMRSFNETVEAHAQPYNVINFVLKYTWVATIVNKMAYEQLSGEVADEIKIQAKQAARSRIALLRVRLKQIADLQRSLNREDAKTKDILDPQKQSIGKQIGRYLAGDSYNVLQEYVSEQDKEQKVKYRTTALAAEDPFEGEVNNVYNTAAPFGATLERSRDIAGL